MITCLKWLTEDEDSKYVWIVIIVAMKNAETATIIMVIPASGWLVGVTANMIRNHCPTCAGIFLS